MKRKLVNLNLMLIILIVPLIVKAGNPYKSTGPYGVNCTWYTWDKALKLGGVTLPSWGNAKTWYTSAQNAGFKVGSEAKNNSVIVLNITNYGHVAYVEKVSDNFIYVWDSDRPCIDEESEEFKTCYDNSYDESSLAECRKNAKPSACKIDIATYTNKIIGFIYLDEAPKISNSNNNSNNLTNNGGNTSNNEIKKDNQTNKSTPSENQKDGNTETVVKSDNNFIKEILLSSGKIDFDKNLLEYTLEVNYDIAEIEINAKAEDSKATLNGTGKYLLNVGQNSFTLTVTAENEKLREYKINILRQEESINKLPEDNPEESHNTDNNKEKFKILTKYENIFLSIMALLAIIGMAFIKKDGKKDIKKNRL